MKGFLSTSILKFPEKLAKLSGMKQSLTYEVYVIHLLLLDSLTGEREIILSFPKTVVREPVRPSFVTILLQRQDLSLVESPSAVVTSNGHQLSLLLISSRAVNI